MDSDGLKKLVDKIKGQAKVELLVKGNKGNSPKPLIYKDSRKTYVPDMIAVYPDKQDFYSIENKITKELLPGLIAKWILFALEARLKSGRFFLVVSQQHSKKCKNIIERKQLNVEVIVIPD